MDRGRDRQGHQLMEYVAQLQAFLRNALLQFLTEVADKIHNHESTGESFVTSVLAMAEALGPCMEVNRVFVHLKCGLADLAYTCRTDLDRCRRDSPKAMVKRLEKKWKNNDSNLDCLQCLANEATQAYHNPASPMSNDNLSKGCDVFLEAHSKFFNFEKTGIDGLDQAVEIIRTLLFTEFETCYTSIVPQPPVRRRPGPY